MPRIAIVSANKELVEFLELEFELCGYQASTFRNFSVINGNFDVILADVDTVKITDSYSGDIIKISETQTGEDILLWPASISDIHRAVSKITPTEHGYFMYSPQNTIYILDKCNGIVTFDGMQIRFSQTELAILITLCTQSGKIVSRTEIDEILGNPTTNMTDVYICNIRKKLEGTSGRRLIFTERSKGYRTALTVIE